MSGQSDNSYKGPKTPVMGSSYTRFKKEVYLWAATTAVQEKKQAGTILMALPEKDRETALNIPLDEIQNGKTVAGADGEEKKYTGVECLLEKLDEIYLESMAKEKFICYDEFRKLSRKDNQNIRDFILEFEKHMNRLEDHGIKMPQEVLAYELLRACNVDAYLYSVAVSLVDDLTYEKMKSVVRNLTQKKESASHAGFTPMKIVKKEQDAYFNNIDDTWSSTSGNFDEYGLNFESEEQDTYYGYSSRGRGNFSRSRGFNRFNYGQSRNRGGMRNFKSSNNRGSSTSKTEKRNPKDQYGNYMSCFECQSIYHLIKDCPEAGKKTSSTATTYLNNKTENITLLQNLPRESQNKSTMECFTKNNFGLAVLDSGCNTTVCGRTWLNAYIESLNEDCMDEVMSENSVVDFKFGDNKPTRSLEKWTFPAIICGKNVKIKAQVIDDEIPLLISKQSMKDAKMIIDFSNDTVQAFGNTENLIFTESGHCSIPLSEMTVHKNVCLCSSHDYEMTLAVKSELESPKLAKKLHSQFGHPPADSLKNLLRSAGRLNTGLSREIEKISSECDICRRYKKPPNKPIVSMPLAKDFNETVAMDIKTLQIIDGRNVNIQHMIDHRSRFSTATVVKNKDKETIVKSIFTHWINLFGTPRKFMTDNGGEYVNDHFHDLCDKLNVHIITTGAESPWSNGLVERHHALIERSVNKIMEETNCSVEIALAWACHAKNSLSNVNGFSPYQLVFGRNPSLMSVEDPYITPNVLENEFASETVAKNIAAIYSARRQQMNLEADEKIRRALHSNTRECYSEELVNGDLIYYKRDDSSRWRGPASIIGCDRKIIFVRHGGYVVRCHRSRVVKVNDIYSQSYKCPDKSDYDPPEDSSGETESPFCRALQVMKADLNHDFAEDNLNEIEPNGGQEEVPGDIEVEPVDETEDMTNNNSNESENQSKRAQLCEIKSNYEKKKLVIEMNSQDPFKQQKVEEIQKWKQNDVYEVVQVDEISEENYPISTRWILDETKKKARLVAKGFEEPPIEGTKRVSPTCRKESLRLLFSITVSKGWTLNSLDIASAFLQGIPIEREVYLKPPKEFHEPGKVWKLKKCVYGLADAAKMWYNTIKERGDNSGLQRCPYDDALFFVKDKENLVGILAVHVDDFIYSGYEAFYSDILQKFLTGLEVKSHGVNVFKYLGLQVSQNPSSKEIFVSQEEYSKEINMIQISRTRQSQKTHSLNSDEYNLLRSGIGQLNWLSIQTRPDIAFDVCQLSNNLKDPCVADLITFNKIVKKIQNNDPLPLTYRSLENLEEGLNLLVYSDAAYNNLAHNGSQSGYLIFLCDKDNNVKNIMVWRSVKIDRVCRSTVAAESLALLNATDHALFVHETLKLLLGDKCPIQIRCFIDSKGLLELVNKTKDPIEKRLIITMAEIREMIERKEIKVDYIPSKLMPADVLTKRGVDGKVLRMCLNDD